MIVRHLHAALVFVAMLWLFAGPASAMLHPQQGQFMQRDPVGYVDGMSEYEYVGSRPVNVSDAFGLWGSDIHDARTFEWAFNHGFKEEAAHKIGSADNGVDSDYPPVRRSNWSYHFNWTGRDSDMDPEKLADFGTDTRGAHAKRWFDSSLVDAMNGNCDSSLKLLGQALHPAQDYVAHGNWNPANGVHPDHTDDPKYDFSGPNGIFISAYDDPTRSRYFNIKYKGAHPGTKRINQTHQISDSYLLAWIKGVASSGNCKCLCEALVPRAIPVPCRGR